MGRDSCHDFYQPILEPPPAGARSFSRFLELVQEVEEQCADEAHDMALMITRLRKVFYDTEGWDRYLIPARAAVERDLCGGRDRRGCEAVPRTATVRIPWTPFDFSVQRDDPEARTGGDDLLAHQEVALPEGHYADLGHLLAGLDAHNFTSRVDGPLRIDIESNLDAVTWLGDLASVLAEARFLEWNENRAITAVELQGIVDEFASAQDMLGNIDPYAFASVFDTKDAGDGPLVSEMLHAYYSGDPGTPAWVARTHRFSLFARAVGLRGWNGNRWENAGAWVDRYRDQVNDGAAMYAAVNIRGCTRWLGALALVWDRGAASLLEAFLEALADCVREEVRGD